MGEENNIFSGISSKVYFAPKDSMQFDELPVVADSELNTIVADSLQIIDEEEKPSEIYTAGCYSFNLSDKGLDFPIFRELMGTDCEGSAHIRPIMVKFYPIPLRKPRNLKYPNKKRKLRVLKKWCKRYGRKNPDLFIKKTKLKMDMDGDMYKISISGICNE